MKATEVPLLASPARPPRLTDPVDSRYQFHMAQQASATGNFDLATQKLASAVQADPGQPHYSLWHSGQALQRWDPASLVEALPEAARAVLAHPMTQRRLLLQAHALVLLWVGVLWTLVVVAGYYRQWPHLCHDLAARFLSDPRHVSHVWLGLLVLAGALALRPGWFGALGLLTLPLLVLSRGTDRLPLTVLPLAAILLVAPWWTPLREALPAADPASETVLLDRALHLPPQPETVDRLQTILDAPMDPERRSRLHLALATQLSRLGRYRQANESFGEVLLRDPGHVTALVGKANNTYYLGQLDAAIAGYEQARRLAPERGEIPYNLAQAYFKKLFVPEAAATLEQSRELGFYPPAWEDVTGESNGYSPVVYLGLLPDEIAASCRSEADAYPSLCHLAAWRQWLCPVELPLFAVLSLVLAVGALLALWHDRQISPDECANCGVSLCADCGHIRDDTWLCGTCHRTVERARSEIVRATLLKNRSRAQQLPRLARLYRFGRLLPGGAHLAVGRNAAGLFRLGYLAAGLVLALFGWAFDLAAVWSSPGLILPEEAWHAIWLPLPAGAWRSWNHWPLLWGGILIVTSYLMALADGTDLRRKLPLRLSAHLEPETPPAGSERA